MLRHDPPDLLITGALFAVLLVAVWAGGWLVAALAGAGVAWRVRRRRAA
jgi:hypothetical protein